MKGLVIYAGKNPAHPYVTHVFYEDPLYLLLSEAVGGHIEIVHPVGLPRPYVMIVNEEGLIHGLDLNYLASVLYGILDHGRPIVGNAVIMKEVIVDGEPVIVGLEPEEIHTVSCILELCRRLRDLFTVTFEEDLQ